MTDYLFSAIARPHLRIFLKPFISDDVSCAALQQQLQLPCKYFIWLWLNICFAGTRQPVLDLDSCQDNSHLRACQYLEVHLYQSPASISRDISPSCVHVKWIFSMKNSLVEQDFPSHVPHAQLQWTCAAQMMAICRNRRCPSSARPEWELTAACFFQGKSKQGPECESFRNSIVLLLSGEWSYSLPQWKLPCALTVMVLISLCPGEDKIDFFFLPEPDLIQYKIFYGGNTHAVCIKTQVEKEATSSITGQQKILIGHLGK